MIYVGYSLINWGVIRGYSCKLWIYEAQQENAKWYIIIHVVVWKIYAMLFLKWSWRADIWIAPA